MTNLAITVLSIWAATLTLSLLIILHEMFHTTTTRRYAVLNRKYQRDHPPPTTHKGRTP